MSLINEMLRDLDKRRTQEKQSSAFKQDSVMVSHKLLSQKPLLLGGGILVLFVAVWAAMTFIPERFPLSRVSTGTLVEPVAGFEAAVEAKVAPVVVSGSLDEQKQLPEADGNESNASNAIGLSDETTILGLGVVEVDGTARLSLYFTRLPEYRLLQNGLGQAQLVISFKDTHIGTDFDIPKLTGAVLKRVSLLPQKQSLQLLVDLNKGAQVHSFQLIEDSDQGYRLMIDIVGAVEVVEKLPLQVSEASKEQHIGELQSDIKLAEKPKISKNKNILSMDKQAYNAGLKKLEQEDWSAAASLFHQALNINPDLLDARLRLVGVLQLQKQLDKAETVLQEGLLLAPDNSGLRKAYARLMLNGQRYSEAIELLQTAPVPLVGKDLEYHALLAALFQESKQFEAARQVYQQLVQIRPQAALWWMGMAISLEQSGHLEQARSAYQKAFNAPGLRPELQKYIQSRLQVL
ncbi:tetratricopeptide repeat protein [uncultured Desulfuromusa sp.]|uniref:tetratricopeptide repeat protein n=1 Tax=uncultured Desulfuromusa sp. TaxID=219183 RepID=UPI002AA60931|nr:tetratricopeptide repeat protein [uncultured Desulfuromusa sp.]